MMFLRVSAVIFGVKILGTTMDRQVGSAWRSRSASRASSSRRARRLLAYPTPIHMGLIVAREVVLGLFIGFCLQLILITLFA